MNILLVIFLCFFPFIGWAACTGSSPTWTSTADYTSLNSCVSGATAGDTINVTGSGTVSWTSLLGISKQIRIIGPGRDTLTIQGDGNTDLIYYAPSTADNHDSNVHFELSGITLDAGATAVANNHDCLHLSGHDAGISYGIKVHDMRFKNGYKNVRLNGEEYGVFFHNDFPDGAASHIYAGAQGKTVYDQTLAIGGATYPYFEGNTFGNGTSYVSETGQAGRIVERFNTTTNFGEAGETEVHDQHGYQGGYPINTDYAGTRSGEIYNNSYALTHVAEWMNFRGGMLRMFNNSASGYSAFLGIREYAYYYRQVPTRIVSSGTVYITTVSHTSGTFATDLANGIWTVYSPVTVYDNAHVYTTGDVVSYSGLFYGAGGPEDGQSGILPTNSNYWFAIPNWATGQDYYYYPAWEQTNNSFFFNNKSLGSNMAVNYLDAYSASFILPNQDYWAEGDGVSNITSGSGAPAGNCTDMNYYGRTDTGQIYKCHPVNTWTLDYTPYTCPHPLTGLAGSCNYTIVGTAGYPTGASPSSGSAGMTCAGCVRSGN
jgi:hypothetical protein